MTRVTIAIAFLAAVFPAIQSPRAAVPNGFHFSGRLDLNNGAFSGSVSMIFTLYDDPTLSAPANTLWSETKPVSVNDGHFHVVLGNDTGNALTNVMLSGGTRYLGVQVVGESEMLPRVVLYSVPYARLCGDAVTVGGASPTTFAGSSHTHAAVDLQDLGCTNGQVISWNGTAWTCGAADPGVSMSTSDALARWDGSQLVDSRVTVDGDGTLTATGTYSGTADIGAPAGGTRLAWYPTRSAFRAGTATADQWDNANVGNYSTALGHNTTASGNNSTALGYGAAAIGNQTFAVGRDTAASADFATAMGRDTTASAVYATAIGRSTSATGDNSTAMGYSTTAEGDYSTAMGYGTTATGNYSTAMGRNTTASGNYSTATGYGTTASGGQSTAMGRDTTAGGSYSTAIGHTTTAEGSYSIAMGSGIKVTGARSVGIGLATFETPPTVAQNNAMAIMGGNVGIGTVSPSEVLEVSGTVKAAGLIHGDGTQGTVTRNVAQAFTSDNNTEYWHLEMPAPFKKNTTASDMFHIRVTGYAYHSAEVIDITFVGYKYYKDGNSTLKATNVFDATDACDYTNIYFGTGSTLYLTFRTGNIYHTSFAVDSMRVGNGYVLKPGDITITHSTDSSK